ncbi:hypothetical protein [Nonomuraea salmonea]|uniref:hypothetical protein n=1 Tax=Nonomuraea salmonea TaxID=46181 RepID=UPI002FEBC59C
MDSPQAERLVRRIAVSELLHAWAHRNANSNVRVLAIQEVVQEEFGLTRAMSWPMDGRTRAAVDMELLYNRRALRDFVRTQYDFTQEVLAARGIEEVVAYRGDGLVGGPPLGVGRAAPRRHDRDAAPPAGELVGRPPGGHGLAGHPRRPRRAAGGQKNRPATSCPCR